MPRTRVRRVRKPIASRYGLDENWRETYKEGEYFYKSFPPGNKSDFNKIESAISTLGVSADYAEHPSGGRTYRVLRKESKKLPKVKVDSWNEIEVGLPDGDGEAWLFSYVNSLDVLCKSWTTVQGVKRRIRKSLNSSRRIRRRKVQ